MAERMRMWKMPAMFMLLILDTGTAEIISDFRATLQQYPSSVGSPDIVQLKCSFALTESEFLSVIWYRGPIGSEVTIYSQTKSITVIGPGNEDIVIADETHLTLSPDSSYEESESLLTMRVNYCMAGTYYCLVTDFSSRTRQSEPSLNLRFHGPSLEINTGVRQNVIRVGERVSLTGNYEASANASDVSFSVIPPVYSRLTQGTTRTLTVDSNCKHTGETTGGSVEFMKAGNYEITYTATIGGSIYHNYVDLTVSDPVVSTSLGGISFTRGNRSNMISRDFNRTQEYGLDGESEIGTGAIIAIVLVVAVVVVVVVGMVAFLYRMKNHKNSNEGSQRRPSHKQVRIRLSQSDTSCIDGVMDSTTSCIDTSSVNRSHSDEQVQTSPPQSDTSSIDSGVDDRSLSHKHVQSRLPRSDKSNRDSGVSSLITPSTGIPESS